MSINEIKIKAFNKLLSEGVISSKEYSKIIAVLSEGEKEVNEKTPLSGCFNLNWLDKDYSLI